MTDVREKETLLERKKRVQVSTGTPQIGEIIQREKKAFHLPKASLPDKTKTVSGWPWSDNEHWGNLCSSGQKLRSNCQENKLWIRPTIDISSFPPGLSRRQRSTWTLTMAFTNSHTIKVSVPEFFSTRYLDIGLWNGQRIFAGWPATINWLCWGSVGIFNLYSQHSIPALSDDMNKLLFSGARPRCNRTWGMDFARLASFI